MRGNSFLLPHTYETGYLIGRDSGMMEVVKVYQRENPSQYEHDKNWWRDFIKKNGLGEVK